MSAPVWDKVRGIIGNLFQIGADTHGFAKDGDDLRFYDNQTANQYPGWTLTELLAGGQFQYTPTIVPSGQTWTVPATKQYIVYQNVDVEGDLVLEGELVVL